MGQEKYQEINKKSHTRGWNVCHADEAKVSKSRNNQQYICTGLEEGKDITSDAPGDGRLTQWRLQNLSSIERSESHAPITKGEGGVWFNPKLIICSLYLKISLYRRVNFVKTYIDPFVC